METDWLLVSVTLMSAEVSARRSACPGCSLPFVDKSTTRKRRRLIFCPVVLVNLRRMRSVPKAAFCGLALAAVRTLAHALVGEPKPAHCGSTSCALMVALRWMWLNRLSGPGAP